MVEVNCFVTPEFQEYIDKHAPDDTPINIIHENYLDVVAVLFFIFIVTPLAILYKLFVPDDN